MWRKLGVRGHRVVFAVMAVLAVLTVVGVALAASITIDSFNSGTISVTASNSTPAVTSSVPSGDALGGQRDIAAFWNTGANVTFAVNAGSPASQAAAYSTDSSTNGYGTITWDGVNDPNTLNFGLNANLQSSAPNNSVFRLRVTNNDLPVIVTLRAYTDDATHYTEYQGTTQGGIVAPQVVDLVFPFTSYTTVGPSGAADVTNIDTIVLTIDNRIAGSDNADFTIDQFDVLPQQADFGDLPSSYGDAITTTYHLRPSVLRLGGSVDSEPDGQPSNGANGDNQASGFNVDDEEGVSRSSRLFTSDSYPIGNWRPGLVFSGLGGSVSVTVNGPCSVTDPCHLRGWIDWNANNVLESSEVVITGTGTWNGEFTTPSSTNVKLYFDIPTSPAPSCFGGTCYARFRLCGGTGGTTDCDSPTGASTAGEVEDYAWVFGPNAVTLDSLQAQSTTSPVVPVTLIAVSAVALIGVMFFIRRRKTA